MWSQRDPNERTFIASRKLAAIDAEGRAFELTVAIGAPYPISEGEWACPVTLEGLHRLRDIHGADSWQAMQLAGGLVLNLLTHFVEQGGRLSWPDTGEPLAPEDLFPKLP